jgi:methionyl-tRNA formyltransferase
MAKVIFMGTPDFSVPVLQRLIADHNVMGVVTQPDRAVGRSGKLKPPPIKQVALEHDIPVYQPEKLRKNAAALATLKALGIPDVYVVAAFGQILPQAVLDIPPHGSLNVHASLLPRWRGAAPIQAVIREGDPVTGITIMKMDAGLDTGPMLNKVKVEVAPDETGQSLHDKLATLGADLMAATLPGYLNGSITPEPQNDALATFAPQIEKREGEIDWTWDAVPIERLMRAFTPWPGTYTFWDDKRLKVLAGAVGPGRGKPGQVIEQDGQVAIGTGAGLFFPARLQLAGGKPLDIGDFVNGYSDFVGATLGA